MNDKLNRRSFMKSAALASATAVTLSAGREAHADSTEPAPLTPAGSKETLPMGRIGGQEYSRLMLGGNLVSGYAHARDLGYVATLMRRYNTEAKILETLEIAEAHGINAINLFIGDDLSFIQKHWKRGGKMKMIAQAHVGNESNLEQFQKAVDEGASAVHVQGLSAARHVRDGHVEYLANAVAFLRSRKVAAGVAAHALSVIEACERAGIDVDFYQKTLHTRDYFTAGQPGDPEEEGRNDNYWCRNPEETIQFMAKVKKPWIAFKVLAAGAIQPRAGFSYALKNGADFLLVGMFDWQIADNAKLARRMFVTLQRERPLYGTPESA